MRFSTAAANTTTQYYARSNTRSQRRVEPRPQPPIITTLALSLPLSLSKQSTSLEHQILQHPSHAFLAPHETVVMQTARTDLENPVARDAFTAHILFDTGSQWSYIKQAIANRLSLKCVGTDTLSIATFSATQPSPIQPPRVHVGLTQKVGSVRTNTANIIPTITGPVHRVVLPNVERVCQHLCLADNLPKQGEVTNIDLLIGNDYYHGIISADRLSVGPSLHLLSSTLGWIVSGRAPPTTDANCSLSTVSMTSVLSTHTNGSQLATAKPHTSFVAGKPGDSPALGFGNTQHQ